MARSRQITQSQSSGKAESDVSIDGGRVRVEISNGSIGGWGNVDPKDPFGNSQAGVSFGDKKRGLGGEIGIGADGITAEASIEFGGGSRGSTRSGKNTSSVTSSKGGIDLRKDRSIDLSKDEDSGLSPGGSASVGITISPGAVLGVEGSTVGANAAVEFGGLEASVEIETDGCTTVVTAEILGFSYTKTYENPRCKPKDPSPSPSPSPSGQGIGYSHDQLPNLDPFCTYHFFVLMKGPLIERRNWLYNVGFPSYADIWEINETTIKGAPVYIGAISIVNGVRTATLEDSDRIIDNRPAYRREQSYSLGANIATPAQFLNILLPQYLQFNNPNTTKFEIYPYLISCSYPKPWPDVPPARLIEVPKWNPPPRKMDKCCKDTAKMLTKIMKVLDIDRIDKVGLGISNRFMVKGGNGISIAKTYPDIIELLIRMLAHGMIFEPTLHIEDLEAQKEGEQKAVVEYMNATSWARAVGEMLYEIRDDGNVATNMDIRTAFTTTQSMVAIVDCVRKLDAVIDALGVNVNAYYEKVATPYDLTFGEKGFAAVAKDLDKGSDALTEAQLPAFLQTRVNPLKTVKMNPKASTLVELLLDIKKLLEDVQKQ